MAAEQFENWGVLCDDLASGVTIAQRCVENDKPFHVRFQFTDQERFEFLCGLCVKKPFGTQVFTNVCIAVDELAFFTSPHYMPEQLENIVRLGRHTQTRFIATTQRPPDINPFIRSQTKEQYLFQMHEPADLDYFRKRIPDAERLITLNRGEYILWTPQTTEKFSALRLPRSGYKSSSHTHSDTPKSTGTIMKDFSTE